MAPGINNPVAGILDLADEDSSNLVEEDRRFLASLFSRIEISKTSPPRCDTFFLYAKLRIDGIVLGT